MSIQKMISVNGIIQLKEKRGFLWSDQESDIAGITDQKRQSEVEIVASGVKNQAKASSCR